MENNSTIKPKAIRPKRGFTMIELLVVMAILAILGAAVLPLSETLVTAQKERELKQALRDIRDAIDHYKEVSDEGGLAAAKNKPSDNGYPPDLQTLVAGSPQAGQGVGVASAAGRHYFLRRIPRDPFADASLPAEQTWGLRSYASPPDQPKAGADVYDVYSTAKGTALDGSKYSTW
jgi:general secretion pathway protein G